MFKFFKKNNRIEIPEWCNFFNLKEYLKFLEEINKYFTKNKIEYKIEKGYLIVNEKNFGSKKLGLVNVAQLCKQDRKINYKNIIKNHFEAIKRSYEFNKEFKKIKYNFETVKKYIGVRLYNYEYLANVDKKNIVGKKFAGDIFAMIIFDLPNAIISIEKELIEKWDKTIDYIFNLGLKNIKEKYPVSITKDKFNNISLWFIQNEHFFAPNFVYFLTEKKDLIGSYGSLVCLPNRHSVIIYPIENNEVTKAIQYLIPTIYDMFNKGPGSLSRKLFWYNENNYVDLEYDYVKNIDEYEIRLNPPEKFIELIDKLEKK